MLKFSSRILYPLCVLYTSLGAYQPLNGHPGDSPSIQDLLTRLDAGMDAVLVETDDEYRDVLELAKVELRTCRTVLTMIDYRAPRAAVLSLQELQVGIEQYASLVANLRAVGTKLRLALLLDPSAAGALLVDDLELLTSSRLEIAPAYLRSGFDPKYILQRGRLAKPVATKSFKVR